MNANIFLSTTGIGIARAIRNAPGRWLVDFLLADQPVQCLDTDPLNKDVIYAGTKRDGILRSNDRGLTWKPAGLPGHNIKSIAVSRLEHGTIYVGTKPALVFISRDGGTHWTELTSFRKIFSRRFWFSPAEPPYTSYVQGIALSPTDSQVIVVGIEFGAVVRSSDGGKTWADHRRGALRDCHSITFHPTNGDWVYEAGGSGVGAAFSRDAGEKWQQPKAGLDRHYGWACTADPARPEVWYASLSPSPFKAHSESDAQAYIFRSVNGTGWEKLGGGLPQPLNYMPYALLTDPASPDHVYAGLSNGDVWHSVNLGDSWQQLPFNLKGIHRSLILISN